MSLEYVLKTFSHTSLIYTTLASARTSN